MHDRTQNAPDFISHYEARWLESDITFVAHIELYLERVKDPNYKDEFTGRPPSAEAIRTAENAVRYFMGDIPLLLKPIAGKARNGEIPPKAAERGISMEEVRARIDAEKAKLKEAGRKF